MAPTLQSRAQSTATQLLYSLPKGARRAIAGKPVRLGTQRLALDAQLLLRMVEIGGQQLVQDGVAESRRMMDAAAPVIGGKPIQPVQTSEYTIPGEIGDIPATLYTPSRLAEPAGLLVFDPGGGWASGR